MWFMTSHQGDPGRIPDTSEDSKKTTQDHRTSKCIWFRNSWFSLKSKTFHGIAAVGPHLRSDWWALVDRYGIYVENHGVLNRDCVLWRRFGHLKSGDKGSGANLREDHSISETWHPEEKAAPHTWFHKSRCSSKDLIFWRNRCWWSRLAVGLGSST